MAEQTEATRLTSHLAPKPFFAGVACAFLGCCLGGWLYGQVNVYRDFHRFHTFISPQTHYYPTASGVRALCRSQLDPDKIAVVVGGNSILFGHAVGPKNIWSKQLQDLLGDRYQVINFAMPSAQSGEFGAIAAEMLERDHRKLLFVTICGSSTCPDLPDGKTYRYFYWDAYYKGLISHDAKRAARLNKEAKARAKEGHGFAELRRGARLDVALRFQDLWTAVTHEHVNTIWTPLLANSLTQPRKGYVESEQPVIPLEKRYPPSANEYARKVLLNLIEGGPYLARRSPQGIPLIDMLHESFPEPCRRRTLMLLPHDSPHYVSQLSSAEQAVYASVFPAFVRLLEADGMPALEIGADYTEWDYYDTSHLSDQGGRRLAADVAPKLRDMAKRLGYLNEDKP